MLVLVLRVWGSLAQAALREQVNNCFTKWTIASDCYLFICTASFSLMGHKYAVINFANIYETYNIQ